MKLQDITLEGFKSYAGRVTVGPFHPNFNAITGPNGTGKSNVFDGLCFAMGFKPGEQMRVGSMDELVFKRGQAGVSAAAVTLVFDNSDRSMSPPMYLDSKKITVTRQYSIGGRDRLFINGHVARQKDVKRMFAEARLNVDQPHFLVMQGRVAKVIGMKPVETLQLFQEAVGTNAFDIRKKESEKLLKEKEDQLAQIQADVSSTLQPTIDHLRKEKENYVFWVELGKKIPLYQVCLVEKRLSGGKQAREECNNALAKKNKEADESRNRMLELKDLLAEKDQEKRNLEVDLRKLQGQGQIETLRNEMRPVELEIAKLNESKTILENTMSARKRSIKDESKKLETLKKNLEKFERENDEQIKAIDKSLEDKKVLESELEILELKIESLKKGIVIDDKGEDIKEKLEKLDSAVTEISGKLVQIKNQKEACEALIKELSVKVGITTTLADIKKNCEACEKRKQELQIELNQLAFSEADYTKAMDSVAALEDQLVTLKSELSSMQRSRHFIQSEEIKKRFPDRQQMPGMTVELFRVKDDLEHYMIALEEVGKNRLKQLVVSSDSMVDNVFKVARDMSLRVTCVPLNMMRAPEIPPKDIDLAKKLTQGAALHPLECIECDSDKYQVALKYVFQNSFICPERATAQILNSTKSWPYCSVCIDGEKWDPSGIISGGSKAGMMNLLLDAKQMRLILERVNASQRELENLKKNVIEPMEVRRNKHSLLEKSINEYDRKILEYKGDIDMRELQDEGRLAHAQEEKDELVTMEKELEKQRSELEKERKPLKKTYEGLTDNREKHLTQYNQQKVKLIEKVSKVQTLHENLCTQMSQVRVKWTEMKSSVTESDNQIRAWESEIQKIQDVDIVEVDRQIERENAKIKGLKDQLQQLLSAADSVKHRLEIVVQEIQKIRENIEEEEQFIQKTEKDMKDLKGQLDALSKSWQSLEDELKRQTISDPELMEQTRKEVDAMSIDELKTLVDTSVKDRAKLQMKIDKRALELLVQAEKDFQALSRDKERVEQERDSVVDFIENLDLQKKKKLEVSLTKVDSLLNQIFSSLLPGATANLIPLSSDLQEGLELSVCLGKTKKQSLNELSGGQKSLLALSLILAMLKLNPAPFYILDEVDAALDLSHTEHLGEMIKRFFSESQFIVVSHKDNLYKNADVLFRTSFANGTSTITRTTA